MNLKAIVLVAIVFSIFLVGCEKSQTSYSAYNQQPQGQQQGQYVGGGCGVAPSADYGETPVGALSSSDSAL